MQFNRVAIVMLVHADKEGVFPKSYEVQPLPKPCVDTGMGLERVAAVLQGVISNYDTDLFTRLIERAELATSTHYGEDPENDASLRIIADHARATLFLI